MPARTRQIILASLALALLTSGAFLPVSGNSFIELDDPQYVFINQQVRNGLTPDGLRWAFQSFELSNWHPLTWVSHMLDVQFFGLKPGRHHLSSLALHLASVLLLLRILTGLTGSLPRAFVVAALFGLHPLRVESVAWVAERKDVLSGFFFMLGLGAYAGYVRRPGATRYLLVVLAFGLGLMSKPMAVTFPCVLLLLDLWPLGRFGPASSKSTVCRLLGEKAPLLAMSAASGVVTYLAQGSAGAVKDFGTYSLGVRLANAALSYLEYLGKMVWPVGLYLPYPHPGSGVSLARALLAALVLGLVSAGVARLWRRRPYLATGWFWYVGMLIPVIGLIQVEDQGLADRYTYLPMVGLLLALVWGLGEILPLGKLGKGSLAGLAILALVPLTHAQTRRWQNSFTLFERTVSLNPENTMAWINLGVVYSMRGNVPKAIDCLRTALRLNPFQTEAHYNLALMYGRMNRFQEARQEFTAALGFAPGNVKAHLYFGDLLVKEGDLRQAIQEYAAVVQTQPGNPRALFGLGVALEKLGRRVEAERYFRETLRRDPNFTSARDRLATLEREVNRPEADQTAPHLP